jgi:hypothetical protein
MDFRGAGRVIDATQFALASFWHDAPAETCHSCRKCAAAVLVLGAHGCIGSILHAVVVCRIVVE